MQEQKQTRFRPEIILKIIGKKFGTYQNLVYLYNIKQTLTKHQKQSKMKNAKNTIAVNANNEILKGNEAEAAISKAKKAAKANTEAPATVEATEAPMSKAERRARATAARKEAMKAQDANKPGELIDGTVETLADRVQAVAGAEPTNTPAVAAEPVAEAPAESKGKQKPALTHISEVKVGSVITYGTSKKPYLITTGDEKGRLLFSISQQFNSTKNDFSVNVLVAGDGTLPESFDIPTEFVAKDRKYTLNDLLAEGKAHLASRQELAAKKAKAETKVAVIAAGPDEEEETEEGEE